ncbi:MAG: O-antigen ligase family protein [Nitrospirota bacterium]|nr:O-antigen ligase family protein [Nitrospirota bacterium]
MEKKDTVLSALTDERVFLASLAVFVFNLPFSEALKEIFLVLSLLLLLLRLAVGSASVAGKIFLLGLPVLLFSAVSLLSALNSIDRLQALRGFWGDLETLMAWVVFSGAFFLASNRTKTLKLLLLSLVSGMVAGGLVGLFQMIFRGAPVLGIMNLGDKNSTAQFLSAVFLLLLSTFLIPFRAGLRLPFLLFSLFATSGLLVLTHSRSFLISLPAASFAMLILGRQWKALGITASAMGIAGGVLAFFPGLRWEMTSVIHPTGDGSFESRYLTWQGALRMFHAHPLLGIGPDTFQMKNIHALYRLPDYASHGHNIFFNMLGEYGLLGVLSFLLILILWLARVFLDESGSPSGRVLKPLTVAFILNLLMAGVAHPMWGGSFSLLFMMIMALVLVEEDSLERTPLHPGIDPLLAGGYAGFWNRFRYKSR